MDPKEFSERREFILRTNTTSLLTNENILQIIEAEDQITNFEASTKAEVHFTGKENIEGYVSLVNMFLRTMLTTFKHPCLINVSNVDGTFNCLKMEDGQIFYHSCI